MTFTINTTIILQVIGIILQVLNAINIAQLTPPEQHAATAVITVLQAIQAYLAHNSTPTGLKIESGSTIKTPEGAEHKAA